ncbi:hypothetical protein ACQ4M3_41555 [Leptolyngbya sp. AN03gr2]|uniref:hypothetical protein n=1 Tax=unclassified Leptolyngbya TaxID=2650499 RepID=UPI003D32153C
MIGIGSNKMLKALVVMLIALVSFISFQPGAYAASMTPEQALSKIDSVRFGHTYPTDSYTPVLDTLGDRCSSNSRHIADMSAAMTERLFKAGREFDNMGFLQQALDATASGTAGSSCEETFAMLAVLIESGV